MIAETNFVPSRSQVAALLGFYAAHEDEQEVSRRRGRHSKRRRSASLALSVLWQTGADDRAKDITGKKIGPHLRTIRNAPGGIEWAKRTLDNLDAGGPAPSMGAPRTNNSRELVKARLRTMGYSLAAIQQAEVALAHPLAPIRWDANLDLREMLNAHDPDDLLAHMLGALRRPFSTYKRRGPDRSEVGRVDWYEVDDLLDNPRTAARPTSYQAPAFDATCYDPTLVTIEQVEELIGRTGLKQEDAAERLGVTARALRHYTLGTRALPYPIYYGLQAIAAEAHR